MIKSVIAVAITFLIAEAVVLVTILVGVIFTLLCVVEWLCEKRWNSSVQQTLKGCSHYDTDDR